MQVNRKYLAKITLSFKVSREEKFREPFSSSTHFVTAENMFVWLKFLYNFLCHSLKCEYVNWLFSNPENNFLWFPNKRWFLAPRDKVSTSLFSYSLRYFILPIIFWTSFSLWIFNLPLNIASHTRVQQILCSLNLKLLRPF